MNEEIFLAEMRWCGWTVRVVGGARMRRAWTADGEMLTYDVARRPAKGQLLLIAGDGYVTPLADLRPLRELAGGDGVQVVEQVRETQIELLQVIGAWLDLGGLIVGGEEHAYLEDDLGGICLTDFQPKLENGALHGFFADARMFWDCVRLVEARVQLTSLEVSVRVVMASGTECNQPEMDILNG